MARAYDSSGRRAAARETRRRILEAARGILLEGGYASMTVASLAASAGVSPQTVYNSVGNKAAVVKACYDVTLVGDDEPVVASERPEFAALRDARTSEEFMASYAAWCRMLYERVGPLLAALATAGAGGDGELAEFFATLDSERRTGTERAVEDLLALEGSQVGAAARRRLVDAFWTLNSPEVHARLVVRSGWKPVDYERWLAQQLSTAAAAPTPGR